MFSGRSWWLKVMGVEAHLSYAASAGWGVIALTSRINSFTAHCDTVWPMFPWMMATVW